MFLTQLLVALLDAKWFLGGHSNRFLTHEQENATNQQTAAPISALENAPNRMHPWQSKCYYSPVWTPLIWGPNIAAAVSRGLLIFARGVCCPHILIILSLVLLL